MKIVLDKAELSYLHALFKLLASGQKDPQHGAFYLSLADKVEPSRLYCNLNRAEAQLLLDIINQAMVNLKSVMQSEKAQMGSILRADVLEKVLTGASVKLATKLEASASEEQSSGI